MNRTLAMLVALASLSGAALAQSGASMPAEPSQAASMPVAAAPATAPATAPIKHHKYKHHKHVKE